MLLGSFLAQKTNPSKAKCFAIFVPVRNWVKVCTCPWIKTYRKFHDYCPIIVALERYRPTCRLQALSRPFWHWGTWTVTPFWFFFFVINLRVCLYEVRWQKLPPRSFLEQLAATLLFEPMNWGLVMPFGSTIPKCRIFLSRLTCLNHFLWSFAQLNLLYSAVYFTTKFELIRDWNLRLSYPFLTKVHN